MSNWRSVVAWLLFWHMICDAYLNPSSGCLKPSEWQQCVYFPKEWFSFCFGIFLNCLTRWWSWRSCFACSGKTWDHLFQYFGLTQDKQLLQCSLKLLTMEEQCWITFLEYYSAIKIWKILGVLQSVSPAVLNRFSWYWDITGSGSVKCLIV